MMFTVAIDGPAAAGKGTLSKRVAAHFGFAHLDTGLIYRATGARVLGGEDPVDAAKTLRAEDLARDDLRTTEVAQAASKCAAIAEVRAALVAFQKEFAARDGGAVLDGRDIGTVICPQANVKLFVTASDEIRAERRFLELSGKGQEVTREGVLKDLRIRDQRDRDREAAPLAAAADAVLIDTSDMDIDEAVAVAISTVGKVFRRR
ncbi:(d)CMP kinase [uncultured Litoreibacter sp.]|uniref:(d)CMP kinase n=1 Tax=uncultured Litoreibacter sp. TaxID=1392394 RepID=UPI0026240DA9|nr:(d)CMP kinase [uncultured Litoreibacter sp.]